MMFGFGKARYRKEVARVCDNYEIPVAVRHYFESFSSPRSAEDKEIALAVLRATCSGNALNEATKCLDKLMKIK